MFKTRRRTRDAKVRAEGFCAFEAKELSRLPLAIPYWKAMRKFRKGRLAEYLRTEKATRAKFESMIRKEYIDNKWTKKTRAGLIVASPWEMLRAFEDAFRAKFPKYESPWQQRRKDFRNFTTKLEATYLKYPKSMPDRRIEYLPEGGAKFVD